MPENPDVGELASVKLPPDPLMMLHAPVPVLGAFAASVVEVWSHKEDPNWSGPAAAVVGEVPTTIAPETLLVMFELEPVI